MEVDCLICHNGQRLEIYARGHLVDEAWELRLKVQA